MQARELSERDRGIMSKRGYVPEDEKQFKGQQLEYLKKAADEVQFLLDQGYDVKPATTFVGNHYENKIEHYGAKESFEQEGVLIL